MRNDRHISTQATPLGYVFENGLSPDRSVFPLNNMCGIVFSAASRLLDSWNDVTMNSWQFLCFYNVTWLVNVDARGWCWQKVGKCVELRRLRNSRHTPYRAKRQDTLQKQREQGFVAGTRLRCIWLSNGWVVSRNWKPIVSSYSKHHFSLLVSKYWSFE
jgi:hypothetical protein